MAVGKNKRLTKGGKKGAKKKIVDPFSKKDWYDVKAPAMFNIRNLGKTLVTRTQGTKIASDGLKGRVFEVSLADLQNDEVAFRKFKLITEDVQGKNCLTNFHGMDLTRDKMCSMVKKWQTMIEAHVDVKTTDGYLLRLFCVGFTKKRTNQIRKTSYAQHQQVRQIRKKMMEIMTREVQTNDLKEVVNKLIPDSVGKDIEKACQSIYPLHDVYVRKVKMLKKPKFELGKLMELHGEGGTSASAKTADGDTGAKVERADGYEPPIQEQNVYEAEGIFMKQSRPRRTRALPSHLRGFLVEGQHPCDLSQLAAVIRLDHTYSCISVKAQRPKGLEERYLKNAAVLPTIRPAASVDACQAPVCQQEEPVFIHGYNVQGYQDIYRSVAEPMMKTHDGRHRPYSLKLGLKIKQRLWEKLSCPSLLEMEQPDGRILINESFSTTNRSVAPQIHVDISEEPLPEKPRKKKPRQ
ncbi:hypothetical protein Q8A67_004645 [Cirrhinus molitorella]|uniref:Small ribosomal subunit protein eS1 n=2 Tax=cellular organisms TaxID=131567 RepID=A0AA88TWM7_9TELE|nr:hypothetical protein Q8A67_004645 [Cirrhinus molitorella]